MRRLAFSLIGVIAAAAIVIGINMFADARFADVRADLTQGKIYTLSNGTKQIVDGLKEPVTLRFFYSRRLGATIPVYGTYADHIREMLEEYASLSHGKVKVEFYDPEPFSETEDRAVAYGLQGVPVDNGGNEVYFGLAGSNQEDDERTIPFFQAERERFLEFDLTKLIYELSNPKRTAVGVMSSLPIDGDPRTMMMTGGRGPGGQPYASSVLLRQTNQVKTVPLDAQVIDPDIQVLLVAEARDLSDATLYAIDQFVMRGGKLMVMVDPWCETLAATPSPTGMPPTDTSSDLKKLFDAWGIVYDPNPGDRRPDRCVARSGGRRRQHAGGELRRLVQHPRRHQSRRSGDRRSDPGHRRLAGCIGESAECDDRVHAVAFQQSALGTGSPRSTGDAGSGENSRQFQAGGRTAGDRREGPRSTEISVHRPARFAGRTKSGPIIFRPTKPRRMGRSTWSSSPTPTSWPTDTGCGSPTFSVSRPRHRFPTTDPLSPT